ncbi:MAG: hypothetical protein KDB37_00360 [Ilumatobacter sp.]|nr:hypothetical protein [Ilumatobacter sp.]
MRAVVGLAVGFFAAGATFFVVDRFGTGDDGGTSTLVVLDPIDYDGYCSSTYDGAKSMRLGDGANDWLCGSRVGGLWSPTPIDHDAVCAWQFGPESEPRLQPAGTAFDWICVELRG